MKLGPWGARSPVSFHQTWLTWGRGRLAIPQAGGGTQSWGTRFPGLWSWLSTHLTPCSPCCIRPLGCTTPDLGSLSPIWAGPGHFSLGHVPVRVPPSAADPLGRAGAAACPLLAPPCPAPAPAISSSPVSLFTCIPVHTVYRPGRLRGPQLGAAPTSKEVAVPGEWWPGAASPQSPQRRGGVYSFLWGPLNNVPSGLKS